MLLRLSIFVAVLLIPSVARAETAEEMLSSCRSFLTAPVSQGQVTFLHDFDHGLCWGAFGAIHGAALVFDEHNARSLRVCVPQDATRTQLIAVFVKYAEANPKELNEDFFMVALNALIKAFPCGKGQAPPPHS